MFSMMTGMCAAEELKVSWVDYAQQVAQKRLVISPAAPIKQNDVADISEDDSGTIHLAVYMETPAATAESSPPATQKAEVERGPLHSFGATVKRDLMDAPKDLWHDTKAVFLNPWNVLFLVGAGGASLALRPEVDDDIEDHYHPGGAQYRHTFSKPFRNFLDAAGNPATGFIIAGSCYLSGQLLQDAKSYEVGKRMASALIITDLSTLLLKVAGQTRAPNNQRFGWPSGHVSSTMAVATVLNDAYGPVVGVPMYGLTAFVAYQRLDSREHQFSDVIFGAALGWVVAETVMKEHRPEICGGELLPYVDPETGDAGVAWLKTLGN